MPAHHHPRPGPIACIGECMVELRELPDGTLRRSYGGDTLNTAVYLARLGLQVDYVTALGDDGWSDEMLAAWQHERVGTALVHRLPGRLPGLYIIQTDPSGERRFLYWRESAAARHLFKHLPPGSLDRFSVLYLSGITLSIYDEASRDLLFAALAAARRRGAWVVFDTNFRPRGWSDPELARTLFRRAFAIASLIVASAEDLRLLFGNRGDDELLQHAGTAEIVLKLDSPDSRVLHDGRDVLVTAAPVSHVVDTTAAGDSFAAAYLTARVHGASPEDAARAGHALAGVVVGYPGAIIPAHAMPSATLLGLTP